MVGFVYKILSKFELGRENDIFIIFMIVVPRVSVDFD